MWAECPFELQARPRAGRTPGRGLYHARSRLLCTGPTSSKKACHAPACPNLLCPAGGFRICLDTAGFGAGGRPAATQVRRRQQRRRRAGRDPRQAAQHRRAGCLAHQVFADAGRPLRLAAHLPLEGHWRRQRERCGRGHGAGARRAHRRDPRHPHHARGAAQPALGHRHAGRLRHAVGAAGDEHRPRPPPKHRRGRARGGAGHRRRCQPPAAGRASAAGL